MDLEDLIDLGCGARGREASCKKEMNNLIENARRAQAGPQREPFVCSDPSLLH